MDTPQTASFGKLHRTACLAYGLVAYTAFFGTFLYVIGFLWNVVVPKSIDSGTVGSTGVSLLVNAAFLGLFAVQHAIMARPWFKRRWTKIIPAAIERSTFVLVTCAILVAMFVFWHPLPTVVWQVENPIGRGALFALSGLGILVVLYSSVCIDHFDLFGLRQVVLHFRGRSYTHPGFAMPWLYRLVRNPLMLGFLIAFWATPDMTVGHLLFAGLCTAYIMVGVQLEERDLLRTLGDDYRRYRERTPMLLPIRLKAATSRTTPATA